MLKGEQNTNAFTGIQIFPKKGKGEIVLKDNIMEATSFQTVQRVTFTSIATVLMPLGVGLMTQSWVIGLVVILCGIGSLVLREVLKVKE